MAGGNGSDKTPSPGNGGGTWELEFLGAIAERLGQTTIDDVARKCGFDDHQAMADHHGFKNFIEYVSAPGSAQRFLKPEHFLKNL